VTTFSLVDISSKGTVLKIKIPLYVDRYLPDYTSSQFRRPVISNDVTDLVIATVTFINCIQRCSVRILAATPAVLKGFMAFFSPSKQIMKMTVEIELHLYSLWVKSCCGCGTGTVREPRARGTPTFGSRCQRTGEGREDREDSVRALVNYRVCELPTAP
jgi:hypothetical protein